MIKEDGTVLAGKPMALIGKKKIDILYTPANRVDEIDKEIETLAGRMLTTVRRNSGHAIAANQVGVPINLVVLRSGMAYINVGYKKSGDGSNFDIEGCLSLPGKKFMVERWNEIKWNGTKLTEEFEFQTLEGEKARIWQHEVDHINGHLLSDTYKPIK